MIRKRLKTAVLTLSQNLQIAGKHRILALEFKSMSISIYLRFQQNITNQLLTLIFTTNVKYILETEGSTKAMLVQNYVKTSNDILNNDT